LKAIKRNKKQGEGGVGGNKYRIFRTTILDGLLGRERGILKGEEWFQNGGVEKRRRER